MKRLMTFAMLLSWAACCVACGPGFEAAKPPGFVEIESEYDEYDYRATTADGVVIAVREIEHDPQGEPEFWLTAIKNRMRDRGGYALLETVAVKSGDGVAGTQLRFGHDDDGNKPHLYYVTLFVTEAKLFLLEAGGTKQLMAANAAKIDVAVAKFSTQ